MSKKGLKYAVSALVAAVFLQVLFVASSPGEAAGMTRQRDFAGIAASILRDTLPLSISERQDSAINAINSRRDTARRSIDPLGLDLSGQRPDTLRQDSLSGELLPIDNFLDEVITSKNTDSLVYNVKDKLVFIYNQGDVNYGNMNLKADYIQVKMDAKELFAHGVPDSTGKGTRPEFLEGGTTYTMDTIAYNINTQKAKIKGVVTQEGDGYLLGQNVKKMDDNVIHIKNGKYTTCEDHDHPHFYLALTKGKVIPGKKVITGYAYLVMEDVPIYFPGIPEAFFPMSSGRSSGFIIPSYGEDGTRGFFLRDGGYYLAINDHIDLTVRGSIYTKGSWEAKAASTYIKRYKYRGNFNFNYAKTVLGDKGLPDYSNSNSYSVVWSHQQDPKASPGSTFTANVNFQTSGYAKYNSTTMQDYTSAQTNSNVNYSKSWAGTPFSMNASLQLGQNRRDSTYSIAFPSVRVTMTKINPFKRKNAVGKERWYEKISLSYSGDLQNKVTVKEKDFMTEKMLRDMVNGVKHSIPVSLSFNLLNYINTTISVPYNEYWYFQKVEKEWDPVTQKQVEKDPRYGFFRAYDYSARIDLNTKLYGMYEVTDKYPKFPLRRIRHTITPTVGFSWAPNFMDPKYGFWKPIQQDSSGTIGYYSPLSGNNSAPRGGKQASLTFSLAQTIELKVKDDSDSTGMRKVKLIDNFSFNGSYNFLADSMKLSPTMSVNLRITVPFIKNFQLSLTGTVSPYQVENRNGRGVKINKFLVEQGKFLRLESTGWNFSYTFNGGKQAAAGAINDTGSYNPIYDGMNPYDFDPNHPLDPEIRRQLMTRTYYDFSVPWSFSFNYSVNYTNDGVVKKFSQGLTFNGSVTLTQKWGISFSGFGYDFDNRKFTPGSFNLTRDLHCWQMNFNWVPFGDRKQWSFNISVKSALLRDLKYDKRRSQFDNIYNESR